MSLLQENVGVHSRYMSSLMARQKELLNGWRSVPSVTVDVQSGLLEGLSRTLSRQSFSVTGTTDKCDIFIPDVDMADSTIEFNVHSSFVGSLISIVSQNPNIRVNNQKVGTDAQNTYRLPVTLEIGETKIGISSAKRPASLLRIFESVQAGATYNRGNKKLLAFTDALLALLIVLLVVLFWPVVKGHFNSASSDMSDSPVTTVEERDESSAPTSDVLVKMLEQATLSNYLTVREDKGAVFVTGVLPEAFERNWRDVLANFEALNGAPTVISRVQRTNKPLNLPGVSMVEMGADPTVYFSDGTSRQISDQVVNHWVVESINVGEIVLRRNSETFAIRF